MTSPTAPPKRLSFLDWRAAVGIGFSALLLWWAFRGVDVGEVWRELRTADPFWYVVASAAATGVFWIRAWRWKSILAAVAPDTAFRPRFAAVTIGFMGNNLLPLRVGEFARAYALSRTEPVPIVASFGSLVVERLFDGIFVVVLLFVAMAAPSFPDVQLAGGNAYITAARGVAIAIALALAILFVLVWKPAPAVRFVERIAARLLPERLRRPLIDALEAFLSGVGVLRNPVLALRTVGWSLVLWLFNAVGFWVGFRAFGLDLPFSAALFLQSAVALAVSLPSAPGFFGPFELATRFVVADMFGADPTRALAYAAGFHLAGFIPVTLIGLYYAWRLGLSLREVSASEEVIETNVERATGVDPAHPDRG